MKERKLSPTYHLTAYKGSKVQRPIMCYIHYGSKDHTPITFSTGITIDGNYWTKGEALHPFEYVNIQLSELDKIINEINQQLKSTVTDYDMWFARTFISLVKERWNEKKKTISFKFIRLVENGILEKVENIKDGSNITWIDYLARTIPTKMEGNRNAYDNLLKVFKEYNEQAEAIYKNVLLSKIMPEYFVSFLLYIAHTKGWTRSNLEQYRKNISVFYNIARQKVKIDNLPYITFYEYKILEKHNSKDTKDVSLSHIQIQKLIDLKFTSDEKELENVRDIFVMGAMTGGTRKSDFDELFNNIQSDVCMLPNGKSVHQRYIQGISKKTKIKVKLPIHPILEHLLMKHNDTLPKFPANFNDAIKKVCTKAGLHNMITTFREDISTLTANKDYGNFITKDKPVSELVTSASMRKTFCTLAVRKFKHDLETIKTFSGHANAQQVLTYIADSGDDANYIDLVTTMQNDTTFTIPQQIEAEAVNQ